MAHTSLTALQGVIAQDERHRKHEILPEGGHDSHPDLAACWFATEVCSAAP